MAAKSCSVFRFRMRIRRNSLQSATAGNDATFASDSSHRFCSPVRVLMKLMSLSLRICHSSRYLMLVFPVTPHRWLRHLLQHAERHDGPALSH